MGRCSHHHPLGKRKSKPRGHSRSVPSRVATRKKKQEQVLVRNGNPALCRGTCSGTAVRGAGWRFLKGFNVKRFPCDSATALLGVYPGVKTHSAQNLHKGCSQQHYPESQQGNTQCPRSRCATGPSNGNDRAVKRRQTEQAAGT